MSGASPEKIEYLRTLLGVDVRAQAASPGAAVAPGGAPGGAAGGAPGGGPGGPPPIDLNLNSPANQAAMARTLADSDAADGWIRGSIATNTLRPDILGDGSGANVMFGGRTPPLARAIDTIVAGGRMANVSPGAQSLITQDRVARLVAETLRAASPRAPSAAGGAEGGGSPSVQMQLSYTFTPQTIHRAPDGSESSDQPAQQIAGVLNVAFHAEGRNGFELAAQAAITIFADQRGAPDIPQSAFAGAQLSWVANFLNGALTAGPLVSVMAGASRAGQTATGVLQWAPTGQVSVGGQVQYAIPGFGGHVLVGLQAAVGGTAARGADPTLDRAVSSTLTFTF